VGDRVKECLQLVEDDELTSVAFVPLGMGRLFEYPAENVAHEMLERATEFLAVANKVQVLNQSGNLCLQSVYMC
jgi:O-acetyl-ADP-ribose deacetylase (regulator of RNase III)